MLSKFTVKNFKNFEKSFCIDFSQTNSYEFSKDCVKNGLVKTGLVYGPNSIGKSNLGKALFDIVQTLTDKEKIPPLYKTYQNALKPNDPVEFRYEFCFGKSKLVYGYKKTAYESVLSEELLIDDKQVLSRDKDIFSTSLKGLETLKRNLTPNIAALRYIRANATLSDNSQNAAVQQFFDFVDRMLMVQNLTINLYQGYVQGAKQVDVEILRQGNLDRLEKFLNSVEVKCQLISLDVNGEKRMYFDFGGNHCIDFWENASTGTRSLVLFFFWYLEALKDSATAPSFMYLDEFDAFYHEKAAAAIIRLLRQLDCQVILTTHDSNLLSNELLRPDCAFNMTEEYRNAEGYVLGPLSSVVKKELREAHNIPKMFRAKTFG